MLCKYVYTRVDSVGEGGPSSCLYSPKWKPFGDDFSLRVRYASVCSCTAVRRGCAVAAEFAGDGLGVTHVFNLPREIHPDGLPPSYTIVLLFRLLPDSPSEPFDIWQISDKNNNPEVGVSLNRKHPFVWNPRLWVGKRTVADAKACASVLDYWRNSRCVTSIPHLEKRSSSIGPFDKSQTSLK